MIRLLFFSSLPFLLKVLITKVKPCTQRTAVEDCLCFSFRQWKLNHLRNPTKLSLFKKTIDKTRNTGTGNKMRRMLDTRGMFTRTPVNLLEDSGERYHFRILRNVEGFTECSRKFQEMLAKILGNISKHSGYCSRRSWGMLV